MNDSFDPLRNVLLLADSTVNCIEVHSLSTPHSQCDFVLLNDACAYDGVLLDYTALAFCQFGDNRPLAIFILFLLLVCMFVCISTVADKFLCPNLLAISKWLNLPDNIAGVTFLAFGNGAPDLLVSVSGIAQSRPELIFASLFGAGIFDTTVVVAAILLVAKTAQLKRPLIRDIIFYIVASFLAFLCIRSGHFTLNFAIGLLVFYAFYIIGVGISRCVYLHLNQIAIPEYETLNEFDNCYETKRLASSDVEHQRRTNARQYSTFSSSHSKINFHRTLSNISECNYENNNLALSIETANSPSPEQSTKLLNSISTAFAFDWTQATLLSQKLASKIQHNKLEQAHARCISECTDALQYLNPIDAHEWTHSSWLSKLYALVAAVPYFCCNICIPTVDLERPRNGWCRLLTCLNILCAPQALCYLLSIDISLSHHFPFCALLLLISALIALLVFYTSDATTEPVYHIIFAFIGFCVGIIFINAISGEIVALLSTFGVIFNLSDSILGMTVLAWGNCLGDLVADIAMAKAGHHQMALSAAFCGPMFNLLIGLGLPYCILFLSEHTTEVSIEYTLEMSLQYSIITVSLVLSLALFLLSYICQIRWTVYLHSATLIALYCLYMICGLLLEFHVAA